MDFRTIHESVIADILDLMKDGKDAISGGLEKIGRKRTSGVNYSGSLARATSGLTLVFPVIVPNSLPLDVAIMISKAIERKNISLLQMAFSAYNITNSTDAISHLMKFHTNMDSKKMDLNTFMDTMSTLGENGYISISDLNAIREDCKRNIDYMLDDSVNESSLLEFNEINEYGSSKFVHEDYPPIYIRDRSTGTYHQADDSELADIAVSGRVPGSKEKANDNMAKYAMNTLQQKEDQKKAEEERNFKRELSDREAETNNKKASADASDKKRQYFAAQLLPTDIKKANEMQPSIMLVNFYVNDKDKDLNIAQQIVAGVKSKLYSVADSDIIDKVITKHIDSDIFLNLIKVSTREISFVKDFLLGLDGAKLSSMSKSRHGSGAALFNALERRALNGKIRKALKMENSAKAISTLVVTQEDADELRKANGIDVMRPATMAPIMEKLNLLYFIVVDTSSEAVHMLTDGDTSYETLSFTSLERDNGEGSYKKIINLMTKVAR